MTEEVKDKIVQIGFRGTPADRVRIKRATLDYGYPNVQEFLEAAVAAYIGGGSTAAAVEHDRIVIDIPSELRPSVAGREREIQAMLKIYLKPPTRTEELIVMSLQHLAMRSLSAEENIPRVVNGEHS